MGLDTRLTRKQFLLSALGTPGFIAGLPASARAQASAFSARIQSAPQDITLEDIAAMERVIGFSMTETERKAALTEIRGFRAGYERVRKGLTNDVAPSFRFEPVGRQPREGTRLDVRLSKTSPPPTSEEDIAFCTLRQLASMIRSKQISSRELTRIYLSRLERYGPQFLNTITITAERAMREADAADQEIARGRYRGNLHGVPYVIKDLFAAKGYPTTWGAEPFKEQVFESDSTVVERLHRAGAILCAKTSVGALAMDDHWFKGKTKNPWNSAQGSSGSSAGSASCMAAGMAAFAIGTETLGSIMSPSHRCRVTGLRPTFGRVSRSGCMALSWTMDKVGPICRTAEDAAMVLASICGRDTKDACTVDRPFSFRPDIDLRRLKIGYLSDDAALDEDDSGNGPDDALKLLKSLGADPKPIKFTRADEAVVTVLSIEAAAAFEDITRDGRVNTIANSLWPGIFRAHQFATGVGYIQAMRARTKVMEQFEAELGDFDVILASDRGSYLLFTTNLTGHPQLYVPFGVDKNGNGRGISLVGRLYDEGTVLGVGARIQAATQYWKLRPKI